MTERVFCKNCKNLKRVNNRVRLAFTCKPPHKVKFHPIDGWVQEYFAPIYRNEFGDCEDFVQRPLTLFERFCKFIKGADQ